MQNYNNKDNLDPDNYLWGFFFFFFFASMFTRCSHTVINRMGFFFSTHFSCQFLLSLPAFLHIFPLIIFGFVIPKDAPVSPREQIPVATMGEITTVLTLI